MERIAVSSRGAVTGKSLKGSFAIELRDLSLGFLTMVLDPDNAVSVLGGTSFGGTPGGGEGGFCTEGPGWL